MTALIIIAAVILLIAGALNLPVRARISYYGGKFDLTVKYLFLQIIPRKRKKERPPKMKRKKAPHARNGADTDGSELDDIGLFYENDDPEGGEEPFFEDDAEPPPGDSGSPAVLPEDAENPAERAEDDPEPVPEKKSRAAAVKRNKKPVSPKKSAPPPENDREKKKKFSDTLDELTEKKDALMLMWELCSKHVLALCRKISIGGVVIDFAAADEDAAKAAVTYGALNGAVYNILGLSKCFMSVGVKSVRIDCLYNTPAEQSRYDGEVTVKVRPASILKAVAAVVFLYFTQINKYGPAFRTLTEKN